MWREYTIEWRIDQTVYRIVVTNPEHRCRGVQSAEMDGVPVDPRAIPLRQDGGTHHVAVVLGKSGGVGTGDAASGHHAHTAT
jgi:cyclic beta-1,2-glucan synthetase